jgi:hypothetical protein
MLLPLSEGVAWSCAMVYTPAPLPPEQPGSLHELHPEESCRLLKVMACAGGVGNAPGATGVFTGAPALFTF